MTNAGNLLLFLSRMRRENPHREQYDLNSITEQNRHITLNLQFTQYPRVHSD